MLRVLVTCLVLVPVLRVLASKVPSEFSGGAVGVDASSSIFLQLGLKVEGDAGADSEAQKLGSLLITARKECVKATDACVPVLSKLRLAVWPHVKAETNVSSTPWMPGWNMEPFSAGHTGSVGESGSGFVMFFRHIFKAAGINIHANQQQVLKNFSRMSYADTCRTFHLTDPKHRTAFTFVREPISRFLSGYEEIEYRSRAGEKWPLFASVAKLLKRYEVGSEERAAAFFEEFLRSGIENNGHIRPQVEFLQPVGGCAIPMDFIGKTEQAEEDWKKLFARQNDSVPPFDSFLAVHSHDDRDKHAMQRFLGLANSHKSVETGAVQARYLRALCWLFLADYAIFEYELPPECQREPMQSAVALARSTSEIS